jgi:hypothetical protein
MIISKDWVSKMNDLGCIPDPAGIHIVADTKTTKHQLLTKPFQICIVVDMNTLQQWELFEKR